MRVVDLADRPDLLEPALDLGDVGGQFIYQGASGRMITGERFLRHWARYFLIALDDDGVPIARALSVPLAFPADDRTELPDHGWDQAIEWAAQDVMDGRAPNALCALEVVIAPHLRGSGLSAPMLKALKARAAETGLRKLIVSVRPIGKEQEPAVPMPEYAARRREDGLLADRWLRTHERLGARVVKVCPFAVTLAGSLADWREWTGVKLAEGENFIPGGIAPVHASTAHDTATYVEPNVWMDHPM
ncbi:Long-chain-fatty-acid--CoA ligase [Amycolatopsis sp. WQ 127309]|uniref:Long-chain-fatty-acid--CoA ligase n=1 Tax=Amycolatopsis sp. WQ 127309 TaxID=2932773 RepID=UPI001FF5AB21|nr:Long-chain-fatty-acid--CoA ligase [Amycolatopsis sp. WQ 127309]UOZ07890.1 Long-chain-fatty-acid--CoA ligase [Amycolatopsis sp. WQ 127309]